MRIQLPMFILAGGLGTRLKKILNDKPKALAPVGDVPFLELLIEHWADKGVENFVLLLGYKSELIINFIKSSTNKKINQCNFEFLVEETQLGTGGAIANAIQYLDLQTNFLVVNSDTWLTTEISGILKKKAPCLGLIWSDNVSRFGSVEIDDSMKIISFNEKKEEKLKGLINSGFYYLDPKIFKEWKGSFCSLEKEIFPRLVSDGKLSAVILDSEFIDIGVPEDYERFKNQQT